MDNDVTGKSEIFTEQNLKELRERAAKDLEQRMAEAELNALESTPLPPERRGVPVGVDIPSESNEAFKQRLLKIRQEAPNAEYSPPPEYKPTIKSSSEKALPFDPELLKPEIKISEAEIRRLMAQKSALEKMSGIAKSVGKTALAVGKKGLHYSVPGLTGLSVASKLDEGDVVGAGMEAAAFAPKLPWLLPVYEAFSTGSGPSIEESIQKYGLAGALHSLGAARPVSEKEELEEIKKYKSGEKQAFMPEVQEKDEILDYYNKHVKPID